MSEQQTKRGKARNKTRLLITTIALVILIFLMLLAILYSMDIQIVKDFFTYGLLLVIILFGIELILLLRFFRGIQLVDHNANILSQGRLNISDIIVDKTRGLESLTIAFNDMKRNLLSFIEATKSNVIVLSDAVDKVTKSIDMSYKGNEQIASNMSTVAEKAQEQLQIVKDTLDRIREVSTGTQNITSSLANIEVFVENTVRMTADGAQHLDIYNEQMEVITASLRDTSNFIETLHTHLNEIDQVGGLIINITEQLKLLSLNSAVEAARAGESGKGFVVVSQEMGKLSNATKDSIGRINRLLNDIMSSNARVSESIGSVSESFHISRQIFDSVKESFYTINKNANILNEDMKKVYEESRMISENTDGISQQGIILHNASNEISSITQDVAAVTEEELAENEEVNTQALSLKNMLSSIERLLKRYKTSVMPVSQSSPKHLKIVFMSPLDHPFWQGVRQGVLYAQNELKSKNADVEYIGFEQMENVAFMDTLTAKLEAGCDGAIIPGYIYGIEKVIEKANRLDIPMIAFNCDFPEGTKRLAYFGPNIHDAGRMAAALMVKCADGEGEVAIICGRVDEAEINRVRRDSLLDIIRKEKKIKLAAEILEETVNDDIIYKRVMDTLKKFPNIKVIVATSGGIRGVCKAIRDSHKLGKTHAICYDYDDEIIELIKQGYIYAAMGQDPFGQGHDPIICLYNYLAAGEKPDSITYTRTEVIDMRSVGE
jgi:methyl-accepting chemotaxis protein/ABC-type sugar transport system substrate-binding protein